MECDAVQQRAEAKEMDYARFVANICILFAKIQHIETHVMDCLIQSYIGILVLKREVNIVILMFNDKVVVAGRDILHKVTIRRGESFSNQRNVFPYIMILRSS